MRLAKENRDNEVFLFSKPLLFRKNASCIYIM